MDNINVSITNQQHKSNAPWILGIIAFCTSIPNILCATVCAAVGAGISAAAATHNATTQAEVESAVNNAGESMAGALVLFIVINILCFIFSFFGKSKISVITGILLILGAILS